MIDASHDFIKDGNKNRLRERDIYKIVATFREQIPEEKYSCFVPMPEIRDKNDYNLNIPRYIDSSETEDLHSIDAHLHGGVPSYDVDGMKKYWNIFSNLKSALFTPQREGFYKCAVSKDDLRHVVYSDAEFSRYAKKVDNAFEKWKKQVNDTLCTINSRTKPKSLIKDLAGAILEAYKKIALIDKYDVYEVLLAYWQDVMADDVFIIVQDGYIAAREWENIVKIIESGKNKGKEKITGWEGKLIPRAVITEAFFHDEQKAIDEIEALVSQKQIELDEIIESAEDGSIINDVLKDSGSLDLAALKAKLKDKSLDGEDRAVLENLFEKKTGADEHKKTLKELKRILEQKVKAKYGALKNDEILELLVNRKWYYAIYQDIDALYTAISHTIAKRVTEIAARYDEPLPVIAERAAAYEIKVQSHLEKMGFTW
jgi:type I restriction enzyme M protein